MEHIDSSSSADGFVVVLRGSDVALADLIVRFPSDLRVSWTVNCANRLLKTRFEMF